MKQFAIALSILMTITVVVVTLLLTWPKIPGLLGEWIGTAMGIMMTPFFLEASFAILGLTIVISINTWRRQRERDEFVDLDSFKD